MLRREHYERSSVCKREIEAKDHNTELSVGCLSYEQMDQIDLTGAFEVLSRMPNTSILIIGKEVAPIREVQGLRLSPDASIAEAELFDVWWCPAAMDSKR